MAILPGRTPRRIYVSGHYDTVNLGAQGQAGLNTTGGGYANPADNADAPGADDDGSGTVLVLELARVFAQPFSGRRTIYGFIDRQNLPGLFRTFDFASPDSTNAQRFDTTVPQQALFMMNSPFVLQQAKKLAARAKETDPARKVNELYRAVLAKHEITASMSRPGNCYDNAVVESFFGTLKTELVHEARWTTRGEATTALATYIEGWYNRRRRHSTLDYLSPAEYELRLRAA